MEVAISLKSPKLLVWLTVDEAAVILVCQAYNVPGRLKQGVRFDGNGERSLWVNGPLYVRAGNGVSRLITVEEFMPTKPSHFIIR